MMIESPADSHRWQHRFYIPAQGKQYVGGFPSPFETSASIESHPILEKGMGGVSGVGGSFEPPGVPRVGSFH